MDRLIVKNFGPLKDIDIELNKVNLFIGENGSGKSVLAKLITVITDLGDFDYHLYYDYNTMPLAEENFKDILKRFNINYLSKESHIEYICNRGLYKFIYSNNIIDIENNLTENYLDLEELSILDIMQKSLNLSEKKIIDQVFDSKIYENILKKLQSLENRYIPAERNILSILNESINSLVRYKVPLPDFLLDFASEYEYARKEIKEVEALNVKYQFDGTDKVYYDKNNYLKLSHSSSGIQSAIPMLLTAKYFAKKYRGIVIEEPEQNLFPKAQDEVVKFIIEQVKSENSNLFLMTHSPYVLSTLNNLIFAHKVGNLNNKAKEQVEELIKEEQWINSDSFRAYFLKDGIAKSIVSKRGLISDNIIDDVSDEVDTQFEELMEIYREYKQ